MTMVHGSLAMSHVNWVIVAYSEVSWTTGDNGLGFMGIWVMCIGW